MSSETPTATPDSLPAQKRRIALPVFLFLATCLSTFWVGTVDWKPIVHLDTLIQAIHPLRGIHVFTENLPQGSPEAALRQAFSVAEVGKASPRFDQTGGKA